MIEMESYHQYADDCVCQAQNEGTPEHRDILLNIALAWLRLAHQAQELGTAHAPVTESEQHELAS
jgi:hypothetical protein